MVRRLLLAALSLAAVFGQSNKQYYEEEPVASMAIRETLWRQMADYTKSLVNSSSSSSKSTN